MFNNNYSLTQQYFSYITALFEEENVLTTKVKLPTINKSQTKLTK